MAAPTRPDARTDTLLVAAVIFSVLALIGTLFAVGIAAGNDGGGDPVTAAAADDAEVTLSEFKIEPATIEVAAGAALVVTNLGTIQHDLTVDGQDRTTGLIDPGRSANLDVGGLAPGTYAVRCSVAGHADAGMTATLEVGAGGTAAAAPAASAAPTPEEIDRLTKKSIDDFLAGARTDGRGAQPMDPRILPDGAKEFEITASDFDWEVSPGKLVKAMGYNGVVPGPMIKVSSGDRVRVVLKNEMAESTSIHWHGIVTPNSMDGVPDVTQPPVKKGETFTYEFVAKGPAVGIYHAHQDSQKQVVAGLFAPFIIDELPVPAGVQVTQRIPMILNDAGTIGFSLNGKSFPATDPILARTGEWVQIDYMNEGLQIHPMHTHGFKQLIIARDGYPVPQPWYEDTVLVAPGQRVSVLINTDAPGAWLLHCHILTHAESERGYFGMATAMVVE